MSAVFSYPRNVGHKGWFNEPAATGAILGLAMLTGMSSSPVIGTGAELKFSPRQFGNSLRVYTSSRYDIAFVDESRSPNQDLELIKTVLKPAVSELAVSLGVSRQTVYNWLNGDAVTQAVAISKLQDLARAAETLEQAKIPINATLLKRKFAKGKTLMQVVEAGESAHDASLVLVAMHEREIAQRELMASRFASRAKTPVSEDFDLPSAGVQPEGDA
ncbi:TPA: hypothetical protein F3L15_16525 [Aeromonas hydrophila]|uniref:hypothetical protein n=1 Tax=Aeromonas hydrophila TaxID=644 RepID=UPI000A67ECC0|nr:hypothetical protein [Aeromonas hydrophila]HAU4885612.1 hypothetical protein [Aeromonas hydrophila]